MSKTNLGHKRYSKKMNEDLPITKNYTPKLVTCKYLSYNDSYHKNSRWTH